MIMDTSSTVWEELSGKHIADWLTNFKGEVWAKKHERLLALWLLSHFTFYSSNEVKRLCKVVYNDLIHLVLTKNASSGTPPTELVNDFFSKASIIPSEAISGSGGFIGYLFRHETGLPMNLFNYSVDNVDPQVTNLITIDDVTLSSGQDGQMARFLKRKRPLFLGKEVYLLTLVSTQSSVAYLKNTFGVNVVPAIQLDARDKCFNRQSDIFAAFPELTQPCQTFAEHYGNKIGIGHPLGFRNGQYTFGFYYNAPDNTLPIFWGQVNGWIPIIKRHHKKYKSRKFLPDERFI
jgi:hypothetical protein